MEKGWTEVYMTASEYKAEMAKDILENAKIKVVILNQHDSAYQTFGEYKLYVTDNCVDQAIQLLKDLKSE